MSTIKVWTPADGAAWPHDGAMRTDDDCVRWEVRRPDLLLEAVAASEPFDRPRTLLARVDGPHERQHVAGVTELWEEPAEDEHERIRLTERALLRLGFSFSELPYAEWPLAVPIVIRPGASWYSLDEREALLGLRYGSNLCHVVTGELLTVTTRGSVTWPDEAFGSQPRATWRTASTTERVAQVEASLAVASEQLTAPLTGECLLHYLQRMLGEFGCTGHRFTERWARGRKVRGRPVMVWAVQTGGCCCDCEVIMNSLGRRSTRRRGLLCAEAVAELEAEDQERW